MFLNSQECILLDFLFIYMCALFGKLFTTGGQATMRGNFFGFGLQRKTETLRKVTKENLPSECVRYLDTALLTDTIFKQNVI